MRGPKDLRRIKDSAVPLSPPYVAVLAGAENAKQPLVPNFIIRVVDLNPRRLELPCLLPRQRLGHHLADPASRELLLDRRGILGVKVRFAHAFELAGDAPAGDGVGMAGGIGRSDNP